MVSHLRDVFGSRFDSKTFKKLHSRHRKRLSLESLESRRLLAVILMEDFEDATVTYTASQPDALGDVGNADYYGRATFGQLATGNATFANQQGSAAYAAQDVDGALPVPGVSPLTLDWTGINVAGFTNLELSWFVAEDDAASGEDWDDTDSVILSVRSNGIGAYVPVFAIEGSGGTNSVPRVDANLDGTGEGAEITNVFTQYDVALSDATTIDIRVTIDGLRAGDEDIAFDNLLLEGDVVATPPTLVSFQRQTPAAATTNADSLVFRATFSEDVVNVGAADFDVSGSTATVTGVTAVNASTYDLTVSGGDLAGLSGVVGLDLSAGQDIQDLDATALPSGEPAIDETFLVDNTAPSTTSFARQDPLTSPTAEDSLVFRVTFSEAVSNVTPADFDATGTTASITSVAPISASVYDLTVSGGDLGTLNGVVGLDLAGAQNIVDLAGNSLPTVEPATDETYTMDNVGAPVTLLLEDFEDPVLTYTGPADSLGDIGGSPPSFYGRPPFSALPGTFSYGNQQGSHAYVAHDIDGATVPATSITLDWTGINISGYTNLNLSWFFAEDDDGGNQDWDASDSVLIETQVNGGGFTNLFAIESAGGLNQEPRVDTNFDGTGDGAAITDVFTQFASSIPDGNTLDIRLTISGLGAGEEDIAFDDLKLVGEATDVAPAVLSFERETPASDPTNADSLVFRATFSEDVVNVDATDFDVSGGTTATVTGVTPVSGSVYDVTVSGGDLAGFDGTVGIDLAGGQDIEDSTANGLPNAEPVVDELFTVDNTAPQITSFTRFDPAVSPTSEDVLVFLVTFAEDVQNVDASDFVPNGTTAGVTLVSSLTPSTYKVTLSGGDLGTLNGVVGLDLAGGQDVADLAGNTLPAGEPATDETYLVDNVGVPVTLLFEDFEDAVITYTPTPIDSIGDLAASDYYGRVAFADLPGSTVYTNPLGDSFYGAQDIDGATAPATSVVLNWTGIDVANFTNLELSWFFAEDDDGANQDWDADDSVLIEIQSDGGAFTNLFAIEAEVNAANQLPRVDTNFDGIGDGDEITDAFTQFSALIPDATTLNIRLTITGLTAGDEDIAFDNLKLVGDPGAEVESIVYFNENAAAEAAYTPDNSGQRSIIRQVEVTFTGPVSVPTGPVTNDSFIVESLDPGTLGTTVGLEVVSSQVVGGKQVVVLNFTGTTLIEDLSEGVPPTLPMIEDGNYRLTIDGTLLGIDANGAAAGVDAIDDFYRLYADADNDRDVDLFDFVRFRDYYNSGARDEIFDFNDNGLFTDIFDFVEFRSRYLTTV